MLSKLIAEVSYQMAIADAYGESPIPDPSRFRRHAEAAISTIRAALKEPDQQMLGAASAYSANTFTVCGAGYWRVMFSASALGEQSE